MTKTVLFFAALITASSLFIGCEKYEYIDYKAMQEAEMSMLKDFYLTDAFDALMKMGDTIDKRGPELTGMILTIKEKGDGDKVTIGKQIGIRYHVARIVHGSKGTLDTDTLYNNFADLNPKVFTVGSAPERGLDYAVQQMNLGGKGIAVLPTSYWNSSSGYYGYSDYYTLIYHFEITYLGK